MLLKRTGPLRAPAMALAATTLLVACSTGAPADTASSEKSVDGQEVGVVGTQDQIQDVSEFCGDEELSVALADGFGGNSWRRITRELFETEAAKCPNITEVLYTDAQDRKSTRLNSSH